MAIRIVQLGSPRHRDEGLRLGTVRRPPRGVPKSQFAAQNWYDAWLPVLAPSAALVKTALAAQTPAQWKTFVRKYRTEMSRPEAQQTLQLLAALSHQTNLSVGCYCDQEDHCHRSVLRELLVEVGAEVIAE